jgi:hypothetical protein
MSSRQLWRHPQGRQSSRTRLHAAVIASALLLAGPPSALAGAPIVEPYGVERSSTLRGYAEYGRSWFGQDEGGAQVGLRIASVVPDRMGMDLELGMWIAPSAVLTPDLDITYPIALGPAVRLAPRVGVSGLLAGGGNFLFLAAGANAGVGLVLNAGGPFSIRTDYTVRLFQGDELRDEGAMHALTVGIGWGGSRGR